MSTAVSLTTPTSSKISSQMSYTPPTIGSAKKKLKFSPKENIAAKKQKYLKNAVDLPIDQESQLTFLLNQYQARDIQASFYKLIGEVGGLASSAFIPMSSQKKN